MNRQDFWSFDDAFVKKDLQEQIGKFIIARVCAYLAEKQINILDISQTIVSGYFNMMMVVDRTNATNSFGDMADEMEKVGEEIGVVIKCQREEIFDKMHRI